MAAVVAAVDVHGDLLRMAIASPGNDFRLGACEAPPAIVSTYLGESLTGVPRRVHGGQDRQDVRAVQEDRRPRHPGIAPFTVPAEDRNRTVALPVRRPPLRVPRGGLVAERLDDQHRPLLGDRRVVQVLLRADRGGQDAAAVAAEALDEHWKVIFNGNGYSEEWPIEAGKRGVWRIDSGVDRAHRGLHEPRGVSRSSTTLDDDMAELHVLPSVKAYGDRAASS